MNSRKLKKIKKTDYSRVLVTETLPYETPVIFSNDGLYNNVNSKDKTDEIFQDILNSLVFAQNSSKQKSVNSTIPYLYKIRKSSFEFRRLALTHPISQWKIKEFYEKYENFILHLCDQSPASIRAPKKIAGTFYTKNSWENINKYKTGAVSEEKMDKFTKYLPSFFSYKGYDRLYKFFDSQDYFDLEKSFNHLWTLDVSKCFDSIYTHCLSWAVKDKSFTKQHVAVEATFAQAFDALMRHANHNETNGIVIGPEVSRIFAEVIFQAIDKRVIAKLEAKNKLSFGSEYSFRRYVDDVFIFGKDTDTAQAVYECYADILVTFNLHANAAKSLRLTRPFYTKKSRITREVSNQANAFLEKFLTESEGSASITPKRIHYKWRLTRSFIDTIKSICSYNEANYDDVSSYLISVFTERIKKLANTDLSNSSSEELDVYKDVSLVFLDVLYFLYGVSPSVGSSYKLCTALVVLIRFSKTYFGEYEETIKQRIYELTEFLLSSEGIQKSANVDGFISLEAINIVLAARELGSKYLLPESTVRKLFFRENNFTYYDIISCLFYIQKENSYKKILRKIIRSIDGIFGNLSDVFMNTEKACLFLDMMSCPYISMDQKKLWLAKFYGSLGKNLPSIAKVDLFLNASIRRHWFVNWGEVDLLNCLEKKELKQAY